MQTLPIDSLLPEIIESLRRTPNLLIEAPPGSGKTTRVPPALLDSGLARDGEVCVLEPRRLATRMAAQRVAEERGESVGDTTGYQVRFEDVSGTRTRLRYLTEGILTRRLLADPLLSNISVIVLDEFHERHLQADLALALLKRLQRTARPDLRIIAMSATLEAAPVAKYLCECPTLRSEGRRFEVEIEHLARFDERPLEAQVEAAVRRLISDGLNGDVLVFLPGAAEIRRAAETCAQIAAEAGLIVLPLHGDLPAAEQDRAVRPAEKRKLMLSTNVAETSVTIEGVVAVIDSGLARIAGHSVWSGLPTLNVARISQASAVQRAGRAGRTRAGLCLRLYTAQDFALRPAFDAPEIERADLAEPALELHAAGIHDVHRFEWFEAPPAHALEAAEDLLKRLRALDAEGKVTATGKRMLRLPLHPRLARLVVEAEARGIADDACLVAALISERDIRANQFSLASRERKRHGAAASGASDLLELLDLFREAESMNFATQRLREMNLDANAVRGVDRVRRQLQRLCAAKKNSEAGEKRIELSFARDSELLIAVLAGYPDRVARRRAAINEAQNDNREVLLAGGGAAILAPESVVRDAEFLVAVDAGERREGNRSSVRGGKIVVRLASAIEPEWLLELFTDAIRETTEALWNAPGERVEIVQRLLYEDLVIDESRAGSVDNVYAAEAARVLSSAALAAGVESFVEREMLDSFLARVEFMRRIFPEANFPALDESDVRAALARLCEGRRSFAELREAVRVGGGLINELRGKLSAEQSRLLAAMAPERVTLAFNRQARVHYEARQTPWLASRLQDFFGMKDSLKIAGGRVALVLHLLAPNNRAVQVTTDLAGFWTRHYPQVRRELSRRYPRHAWPDDPLDMPLNMTLKNSRK